MDEKRKYLPKRELLKILQNNHIGEIMHEFSERIYIGDQCYKLDKKCIRGRYMYAVRNANNEIVNF